MMAPFVQCIYGSKNKTGDLVKEEKNFFLKRNVTNGAHLQP